VRVNSEALVEENERKRRRQDRVPRRWTGLSSWRWARSPSTNRADTSARKWQRAGLARV